ncbi:MFS transporter [Streptomyces misionensis]|uniref:MFS transporter n=1 Tax=Streptomyces misionensis TaxID=67331 RepID=UPI0033AB7548
MFRSKKETSSVRPSRRPGFPHDRRGLMSPSSPLRPDTCRKPAASTSNGFGLRFTFPLMLGTTMNPVNSSMIATGLAGIAADFHLGPGPAASLVSVLYLCSAVMQPTMGKLAAIFGPRKIFLTGVAILLAGGAIGTLAPGFRILLLSRALIGIGSSACYPAAMALVRRRAERLKTGVPSTVLGNFSIASQIVAVLGLPLGGVLAGAFGWRALFFVNVPLAAFALVFAAKNVERRTRPPNPAASRSRSRPSIPSGSSCSPCPWCACCSSSTTSTTPPGHWGPSRSSRSPRSSGGNGAPPHR